MQNCSVSIRSFTQNNQHGHFSTRTHMNKQIKQDWRTKNCQTCLIDFHIGESTNSYNLMVQTKVLISRYLQLKPPKQSLAHSFHNQTGPNRTSWFFARSSRKLCFWKNLNQRHMQGLKPKPPMQELVFDMLTIKASQLLGSLCYKLLYLLYIIELIYFILSRFDIG